MCVTALEAFGCILHDRDHDQKTCEVRSQPLPPIAGKKAKTFVASSSRPRLELINVDCETRIRRTGIPTRRSDYFILIL